ncbi:TAT-variant-translocated molybdopterin oxidoreductase [Rhodocaloribacter litoris]|uniref:TAT-variant-translocated molybdopterin oxidoreductase n=1 Tax=Rhodocaloribacter litoris TaxID=2558931 RepID=UPI00141F5F05|nr:TAT-variant-translocated molybdopterin oxidoreductase [Rhodocaloribacter litoris]QXD15966.1 TAT-variant-translocated molybdopterin oxidoreductase [Rhodocaloribacter litoris]
MIELPILDAEMPRQEQRASARPARPRFWRSLDHLHGDPEFERIAQHEFMPGASELPSGASRRQFLQLMGASMALAGLTACRRPVQHIMPFARKPEEMIPGIPMQYATSMPFRGVLRPLLVESHDGRPTKIEGNPEHPESRGTTGVFEQASILNLYDPDRSQQVLRGGDPSNWRAFVDFCERFLVGAGSKRVAVLAEASSSMTMAALRQRLAGAYGRLLWVTYDEDPGARGLQQAFGRPVRARYDFARARTIVSLDADFLGPADRDMLHNTRSFAAGRRVDGREEMSRLYVVESGYSITGGMADNRLRLRSSEIPALAAALAARLGLDVGTAGAAFADHPYVVEMARDLRQAGAEGVVLAGETQPPAVHALCAAINSALGSLGRAVQLFDTGAPADDLAFEELVGEMQAGNVDALLILGCNPVYDAPADLDFAGALARVPETIHVGLHVDETAAACRWHVPRAHYLEAWGDGRAYDGTMAVVQPLIAPLYDDAHSDLEVLNTFATGLDQSGYDLVREQWRGLLPGDFEPAWRRVLHDGFLPGSGYAAVTAAAAVPAGYAVPAVGADDIEVVFRLDPKVLDGSFANNAWMQELPDPTTKVTWDNVAVMSPATAERLGVRTRLVGGKHFADRIRITAGGNSIEAPVWVQPGYADNSIGLTLGYGRTIRSNRPERKTNFFDLDDYTDVYGHGAVATGVGVNVAPLRTTQARQVAVGVQVEKADGEHMVASTQDHGALPEEMEQVRRRNIFRMATLEEYRANPAFVREDEPRPIREPWEDYPALWEENHPSRQEAAKDNPYYKNQWAMVIDLQACTGCNACVVACQAENNIQVVGKEEVARGREMHWIRLDRYFVSDDDNVDEARMVMQPVPCMHCENAPCESVCPVAATVHSPDGTNQMIYNRCIGTRYCANNCPYKVRRFNYYNWTKTLPVQVRMTQNPNVTVRSRGVMEKCSYCIQRIREANKRTNLENRPIRDGEVLTACQQACPAQAITFGDLNDPNSRVNQARASHRRYELLAELAVKPRTSYLARVTNPNPRLSAEV